MRDDMSFVTTTALRYTDFFNVFKWKHCVIFEYTIEFINDDVSDKITGLTLEKCDIILSSGKTINLLNEDVKEIYYFSRENRIGGTKKNIDAWEKTYNNGKIVIRITDDNNSHINDGIPLYIKINGKNIEIPFEDETSFEMQTIFTVYRSKAGKKIVGIRKEYVRFKEYRFTTWLTV